MRNFFLSFAKKKFSNFLGYIPQNYGKFSGNLGDANRKSWHRGGEGAKPPKKKWSPMGLGSMITCLMMRTCSNDVPQPVPSGGMGIEFQVRTNKGTFRELRSVRCILDRKRSVCKLRSMGQYRSRVLTPALLS